jgi:hypothetical protein
MLTFNNREKQIYLIAFLILLTSIYLVFQNKFDAKLLILSIFMTELIKNLFIKNYYLVSAIKPALNKNKNDNEIPIIIISIFFFFFLILEIVFLFFYLFFFPNKNIIFLILTPILILNGILLFFLNYYFEKFTVRLKIIINLIFTFFILLDMFHQNLKIYIMLMFLINVTEFFVICYLLKKKIGFFLNFYFFKDFRTFFFIKKFIKNTLKNDIVTVLQLIIILIMYFLIYYQLK